MEEQHTEVLVIGGGPAGTTFAALMRKHGWTVTLLERGHHPKFHIGESLLPMCLPILDRLGVLDEVRGIGVVKRGADFTIGNGNGQCNTICFSEALGNSPDHAFEVRRSDFDQILFKNCDQAGVDAIDGMRVCRVERRADGAHVVEATADDGSTRTWVARFVADASGRDTFMASSQHWKKRNKRHASAAVYTHFRGVARRPGADQGNISIYWFENGWIWMIPLEQDIMSVGVVCNPKYLKTRSGSLQDFLMDTLNQISETRERTLQAEVIQPVEATGNYSYASQRSLGNGFILLGDAFAFIDPVFSSGVYLAMSSAERAIPVAEAWLQRRPFHYRLEAARYQRDLKRALSTFSWFIYKFTSPTMSSLMSNPRNVLRVAQAVISMLAGDVYANAPVRRRLVVFKSIYYISCLFNWRSVLNARRMRAADVRLDSAS